MLLVRSQGRWECALRMPPQPSRENTVFLRWDGANGKYGGTQTPHDKHSKKTIIKAVIMMMVVIIILPNHHHRHQLKNTCCSFKAESSRRALRCTVEKSRAEPTGSFTQLYWRLCINTHAHLKCKPEWTQVQPNLDTPPPNPRPQPPAPNIMSSCKDVWMSIVFAFCWFFYKKKSPPKQQSRPLFLKSTTSLTRGQARLGNLVCTRGLEPPNPPTPYPPTHPACQVLPCL